MEPVFDAYVMVDWSAARRPVRGANGVWWACLLRDDHGLTVANPATRQQAIGELADLLSDLAARGLTVLVGFDFAFGLPRGFAGGLGGDWRTVWRRLATEIRDTADNDNNRFAVAARLNAELCGRAAPFWGCDAADASETLGCRRPEEASPFPDFRLTEERASRRGLRPQSPWKLWTAGNVGGQTLVGIPRADELRRYHGLAEVTRVWPFETGLRPLHKSSDWRILLAEVYPSMVPAAPTDGEVKDRAQVVALSRHFADLDQRGRLSGLFAGDPGLTEAERAVVEGEEGWILGVAGANRVDIRAWIKDPAEIYRQSFAAIRREADLARVPEDLRDLAVRVVHACGMTDAVADLAWSDGAGIAGREALRRGAPILVDAEMVAHGIIARRLPLANKVICTLNEPSVARMAAELGTTRSAMSVELWRPHLEGAVVAVGNAPTALFRLLEMMEEGAPRPALVLGFAVGFVGAEESKEALMQSGLPFVCIRGRRGGSAMAAAAVNALAAGNEE